MSGRRGALVGLPRLRHLTRSPTTVRRACAAPRAVRARAYVPGVAWALLLLALGSWSGAPGPRTDLPLDKAAHLALYGVLGVLTGLGWLWANWPRRALIPLCLALLVGPMDELNQRSVPERSAEWGDLVADTTGVLAGFALSVRRRRRLPIADDHDD